MSNQAEHADPPPKMFDWCPLCNMHLMTRVVKPHLMGEHKRTSDQADEIIERMMPK